MQTVYSIPLFGLLHFVVVKLVCIEEHESYAGCGIVHGRFNSTKRVHERGQTKFNSWSSRFGIGRAANNSHSIKIAFRYKNCNKFCNSTIKRAQKGNPAKIRLITREILLSSTESACDPFRMSKSIVKQM